MTVSVTTEHIPDRLPNQDEALVLFAMRRNDPENPTGSPDPDLGTQLSSVQNGTVLRDMCLALGFDPEQSYVTVAGVTDVEQGGAVTIAQLVALQNQPSE